MVDVDVDAQVTLLRRVVREGDDTFTDNLRYRLTHATPSGEYPPSFEYEFDSVVHMMMLDAFHGMPGEATALPQLGHVSKAIEDEYHQFPRSLNRGEVYVRTRLQTAKVLLLLHISGAAASSVFDAPTALEASLGSDTLFLYHGTNHVEAEIILADRPVCIWATEMTPGHLGVCGFDLTSDLATAVEWAKQASLPRFVPTVLVFRASRGRLDEFREAGRIRTGHAEVFECLERDGHFCVGAQYNLDGVMTYLQTCFDRAMFPEAWC